MIHKLTVKGNVMANIEELNWVNHFCVNTNNNIREVARNFLSPHTHYGLIWYLHYCWANNIGACIRPDSVWFTIISEIASYLSENKDAYKHLITKSKKQVITKEKSDLSALDINELTRYIKSTIVNKNLYDIINDTVFMSEAPLANYAIRMNFVFVIDPPKLQNQIIKQSIVDNTIRKNCGIPLLSVQGSRKDWDLLYTSVERLLILFELSNKPGEWGGFEKITSFSSKTKEYLEQALNIIANIIYFQFDSISPYQKKKFIPLAANSFTFFNNIFHYGNTNTTSNTSSNTNANCVVNGWARGLYLDNFDIKQPGNKGLSSFKKHLSTVPYVNLMTGKMLCQTMGMTFSSLENEIILNPMYGVVKFDIKDKGLFQSIVSNNTINAFLTNDSDREIEFMLPRSEESLPDTFQTRMADTNNLSDIRKKGGYNNVSADIDHSIRMTPLIDFSSNKTIHDQIGANGINNQYVGDIHPDMRHTHQIGQIPPPQSVLFGLDMQKNVGKSFGGEYIKAFDRDPTLRIDGGSLPMYYSQN